jgi:hypothetical protein
VNAGIKARRNRAQHRLTHMIGWPRLRHPSKQHIGLPQFGEPRSTVPALFDVRQQIMALP